MENMGERLSDLLRRAGKLNPDQVLDWIEPVVAQLAEVHRQGRFQRMFQGCASLRELEVARFA